jgi:carboxymethylenebutenolidase
MANQLAIHAPDLKAAVPFYGRQPDAADVPKIKAAVQLHYGGLDERVNAGIPAYEAALKAAGIPYELYIYEGAQHAFNNDTAPTRYNEAAAKLAWERTTKFLKDKLV